MRARVRVGNEASASRRRYPRWLGAGMASCSVVALFGAWREVAHHDGLLLVATAASTMPLLSALLARRMAREKSRP